MKDFLKKYGSDKNELTKENYDSFYYIFDTNTLLNLYRYSYETSNSFLKIIEKLKENIWIPYHTALEFNNNRNNVMNSQIKAFEETKNAINGNYSDFKSRLKKLSIENRHPSINIEALSKKYKDLLLDTQEMLDELSVKYKKYLINDPIFDKIQSFFDKKIGHEPSKESIDEWQKQASERLKKNIPPGYKDGDKKDCFLHNGIIYEKKFSDYILWFQILEKLEKDKISKAIFISDDRKEDWIEESLLDETKFLRNELLNEVNHKSDTEVFITMSSIEFVKLISENKIINVKESTIKEMFEDSKYKHLFEDSNRIPYVIVMYPEENKVAVYNRGYKLIRESASTSLINYVLTNHVQKEPFFSFTHSWQQPTWMHDSIKGKCITYWLWEFEPQDDFPLR